MRKLLSPVPVQFLAAVGDCAVLDEQSGLQICFGSKDNSLCSNEELRLQKRLQKDLKSQRFQVFYGPSVEIRTQGLLNPIQARYQTSPHPDFLLSVAVSRRLVYNSTVGNGMQVFFSLFSVFSKFLSSHPLPRPFCQNRPPFPLFSSGKLGKKLDSILCSVLHSVQKIFLLEMLQIVHNFRKNLLFLLPALPFSNCFTVRRQKF